MIRKLAGRVYRMSAKDVVQAARGLVPGRVPSATAKERAPAKVDEAFLRSSEYAELMSRHLPHDGSFDLHEAQNETRNFRFRHHERAGALGVFRWRGIQKHLDSILSLVARPGAKVLDLGGAAGPLGLESAIVDRLDRDVWGRPVPFHSLEAAGCDNDVVFSSHALEHMSDLDAVLGSIRAALKEGGHLLLHVPAFTCERWRAGVHASNRYNDHVWTFGLGPEPANVHCKNYVDLLPKVKNLLELECAEYCGDDSIFIRARRA